MHEKSKCLRGKNRILNNVVLYDIGKMKIEDRIGNKEYRIGLLRDMIKTMERMPGFDKKYIQGYRDEVTDLEKSIEHDREVQKLEAQTSGRKEWWHHPGIYFVVYVGGLATIEFVKFIIANL